MTKTKINLLKPLAREPVSPQSRKRGSNTSLFTLIFAFILIGFEMAFLATFYKRLSLKMIATQKYHSDISSEITNIQHELVKLRAQQKITSTHTEVPLSKRLSQDNESLIKILEIFGETLPTQAWIERLSQKKNRFVIDGFAFQHQEISHFLMELEKTKYFKDVKLVKSEQLIGEKGHLKKFSIACDAERI